MGEAGEQAGDVLRRGPRRRLRRLRHLLHRRRSQCHRMIKRRGRHRSLIQGTKKLGLWRHSTKTVIGIRTKQKAELNAILRVTLFFIFLLK
uniref:Uncharacterized protein n=1 Tax=Musa acuminata subsp. malaccensis TaxID=214687 RepID=A0A804KX42_MUSAM